MAPEKIRRWRAKYDVSQAALAQCFGVSLRTLSRVENGQVPVPGWMPYALRGACTWATRAPRSKKHRKGPKWSQRPRVRHLREERERAAREAREPARIDSSDLGW